MRSADRNRDTPQDDGVRPSGADPSGQKPRVVSVKKFISPKGHVYSIIQTTEVDDYDPPLEPGRGDSGS